MKTPPIIQDWFVANPQEVKEIHSELHLTCLFDGLAELIKVSRRTFTTKYAHSLRISGWTLEPPNESSNNDQSCYCT